MDALPSVVAESGPVAVYVRGVLLLAVVWGLSALVRDPAARHVLWFGSLLGLLVLPVLLVGLTVEAPSFAGSPPPVASEGAGVAPREGSPGASAVSFASGRWETPIGVGLLLAWAVGAIVVGVRSLRAWWHLGGVSRRARPAGPEWDRALREAASTLALRRSVDVLVSDETDGPFVRGVSRPCVVVPTSALAWPPSVRRSVLLHELAHVRRSDLVTGSVADLCCAVHWVNPLVWVAARRLRFARELACDAVAVRAGVSGPDYSDHLLRVARLARRPPPPALSFAGGDALRTRVVHALGVPARPAAAARLFAVLALALSVPLSAVRVVASPVDDQATSVLTEVNHEAPAPPQGGEEGSPRSATGPVSNPADADEAASGTRLTEQGASEQTARGTTDEGVTAEGERGGGLAAHELAGPEAPSEASSPSQVLRVTSASGLPVPFDVVRLVVGGDNAKPTAPTTTPFEIDADWDIDAEVLSEHEVRVELVRGGGAVLTGDGRRVVLSQSGRGAGLEGYVRAYDD